MKLTTISVFLLACLSLKAAVETQYLQGLTSPVQANIDSRVLDTGDTMTGNLRWSGTTIPGLVPNNLTALQIGNLVAPPVASTVFNTTSGKLNMWDGSVWNELRIGNYVRTTGDTMTGPLVIGGGTVTASTPVLDLSQTWTNGAVVFEGISANFTDTASSASSYIFRLKVGGADRIYVNKAGTMVTAGSYTCSGGTIVLNSDTVILREAANTLALRNSTSAQTWNVYGTADAGLLNYRRIRTTMTTGGAVTIAAEGLGTGVSGNTLAFSANGTTSITIGSSITISSAINMGSGVNFSFSTGTGTKFGTGTTEKIGFWNATPIVQPSGTGETVGFTAGGGRPVADCHA